MCHLILGELFGHGFMERTSTLPANLSRCLVTPGPGAGPASTSVTGVHRAWAWRTRVLRESETVGRSGGRQGAGVLWEVADAVADSAVGMGEVWFFPFQNCLSSCWGRRDCSRGGGKPWLSRTRFRLADISGVASKFRVWLNDGEAV